MIDIKKTYRTRNGRKVRIYATDGLPPHSVHGAFFSDGEWHLTGWLSDGTIFCSGTDASRDIDLIEVKPRHKKTFWFNFYDDRFDSFYYDRTLADEAAKDYPNRTRIACIKVELDFEEGEGL